MNRNSTGFVNGVWQPPPRKSRWWIWLLLILGLLILGLLLALLFSLGQQLEEETAHRQADVPYVGLLYVEGTMMTESPVESLLSGGQYYDHEYLLQTVDEMMQDENNQGLLLYIDSPGGEVLAADELGRKLLEYKESTQRPLYVYGHAYAASGGYWLACLGDEIFLQRYCITGSIGVTMGSMLDISKLLEEHGIVVHDLSSGAQKTAGSLMSPPNEETIALHQTIVDEYYGYFLDWILQNRTDLSYTQLQQLADGRIFTASQAVENGLADHVGELDDAILALLEQCDAECEIWEFFPPAQSSLLSDFFLRGGSSDLAILLQLLPPSGVLAYYQYR
ncbi:MAG: S49 family peptidase [Bacillota bacterium]|nr:S49 family peptidase [Bacillota bacterium]